MQILVTSFAKSSGTRVPRNSKPRRHHALYLQKILYGVLILGVEVLCNEFRLETEYCIFVENTNLTLLLDPGIGDLNPLYNCFSSIGLLYLSFDIPSLFCNCSSLDCDSTSF